MGKFGPRKQGATGFVRDMMEDIKAKRRWVAQALGVREDDPGLTRRIEELGQLRNPPGGVSFDQLGSRQMMQEQERMHVGMMRQQMQRPVAVSNDASELEVEMAKTLNRGRSLLHSLIVSPGASRRGAHL